MSAPRSHRRRSRGGRAGLIEIATRRKAARSLPVALALAVLAVAPGAAQATDPVVVPGAVTPRMTALDGVLVWISGTTLMQRAADGTVGPVPGVPAASYPSIDLGHDAAGALVLTYLRCAPANVCVPYADDLNGTSRSLSYLVAKRCRPTVAPSLWQDRVAYGLSCSKVRGRPNVHDAARSGLFVRKGAAPRKRLRRPAHTVDNVAWVDLFGVTVGAAVQDREGFTMYAQTVNGSNLRATSRSGSGDEGTDMRALVNGLSLGTAGELWAVAGYRMDQSEAEEILRLSPACWDREPTVAFPTLLAPDAYSMAVDGPTIYLSVPGIGIVTHVFTPDIVCAQ